MEKKGVYNKIRLIRDELKPIAKDGTVSYKNIRYSYQSIDGIISAVRELLKKHNLIIVPINYKKTDEATVTVQGGEQRIITVECTFKVLDVDDGSSFEVMISGEGQDSGDKAIYKAYSGALKYLYKKLFEIEAGEDDYDKDASVEAKKIVKKPATSNQIKYLASMSNKSIEEIKAMGLSQSDADKLIKKIKNKVK